MLSLLSKSDKKALHKIMVNIEGLITACPNFFAKLCNPIPYQPIELESCSNPQRIQEVM